MIKVCIHIFQCKNKAGLFSQYCIHLNNLVLLREKLKKIKLIKHTCLETNRVFHKIKRFKRPLLTFKCIKNIYLFTISNTSVKLLKK